MRYPFHRFEEKNLRNLILQITVWKTEDYGPNTPNDIETPNKLFLQIFRESLIEHIVFHTNLYAVQKITQLILRQQL